MQGLLKKAALFFSFLALIIALLNYDVVKDNMNTKRSTNCTPLNITIEETKRNKSEVAIYTEVVYKPSFTFYNNVFCIDDTRCGHVHFKLDSSLPTFLTKDFLVLQNHQEFLVVSRHFNPEHSEHLLFFTFHKDIHLRHADKVNFHSFPDSNIFVFESDKLYIVYLIQDRHIETCLFLYKTTPNYVQHIIPVDDNHFIAMSLPKRKQIMVQLFNFKTKKVVRVVKKALTEWIQKYRHTVYGKSIVLSMHSATGSELTYLIDEHLNIIYSQKYSRFKASMALHSVSCRPIILSKMHLYKYLIKNTIIRAKYKVHELLDHFLKGIPLSYLTQRYHSSYYPPATIKFKSNNKIVTCGLDTNECDVLSLGKHLIPTPTPVFHNEDTEPDLEHIDKLNMPPKPFIYVGYNGIHTSDYIFVYEVHPKTEVEWLGLTKSHLHFYPYNKNSEISRYVRTQKYTMVFEGSKYKGRWPSQRSPYYIYQELIDPPKALLKNIWEGHRAYYTLFADLTVIEGKVFQIKLWDGTLGRQMRVFDIQGKYNKNNVLVRLFNNYLIIALYDETTDKTKLTKVYFYYDYTDKNHDLLELQRYYSIYSKVIAFTKLQNKYFVSTSSGGVVSLFTIPHRTFSNRRSHLYEKNKSTFEKKMILYDLIPFNNILEFEGAAIYAEGDVVSGYILYSTGSINFIGRLKEREEYMVFNVYSVIEDRVGNYKKELYIQLIVGCLFIFPAVLLMSCLIRRKNKTTHTPPNNLNEKTEKSSDKLISSEQSKQPKAKRHKKY